MATTALRDAGVLLPLSAVNLNEQGEYTTPDPPLSELEIARVDKNSISISIVYLYYSYTYNYTTREHIAFARSKATITEPWDTVPPPTTLS